MDFSTKYHHLLLASLLFIWCFERAVVESKQVVKCDSKSGLCNGNEMDSRIKLRRIMEGPLSILLPFKHFWRRRSTTPHEDPSDTNETSTYNPWHGNETTQENRTDIFWNTTNTSEWYNATSTYNPWHGNETTQENRTDIFWNTTDTSEWYNETSTYNPWHGNETTQENSTDIFWNTTDTSEWYNETSTYNPWHGNETTQENRTDISKPVIHHHFWRRRRMIMKPQPISDVSEGLNKTSINNPWYGNETAQENRTDISLAHYRQQRTGKRNDFVHTRTEYNNHRIVLN